MTHTSYAPEDEASPALLRETGPHERILHLIKVAFRGSSRALQSRLRHHGVLYGHWTLLRILWQLDGMTQRQLSEQAGIMESTAFGALQAMEKLGYITRQKLPGNNKQIRIFLTPQGAALRNLIVPLAEETNRIAITGVPDEDLAVTRRSLVAIIENLNVDEMAQAASKEPGQATEKKPEQSGRPPRKKTGAGGQARGETA
ncbi:MarR family winged helix-turn-helix transcriptional regulator [Pusillimonas noertemannii]|uniref:MarR family winged helix-turn-helix transcriptional regulator n=1 Tax=Pusillimonas noertemannii TaxID=305977 RepID=UPI0002FE61B8|nr:MarR family transcriptional regulator [Pusillimonas noertemannii]